MTLISDTPKKTIDDLAIFGGKPLFAEKLYVGRPNLGDRTQLLNRINNKSNKGCFKIIINELKQFFQELYKDELDKIVLFGSRARGDYCPDSDVDILIILKNDFNYSQEIEKTSNFIAKISFFKL